MWKRIVRGIALSFALVLTVFIGILAGLANSAAAGAPDRLENPFEAPPRLYRYPPEYARFRARHPADHVYSPVLPPRIDERSIVLRGSGGPRASRRDPDDLLSAFLASLPPEGGGDSGHHSRPRRRPERLRRDAAPPRTAGCAEASSRPPAGAAAASMPTHGNDAAGSSATQPRHPRAPHAPRVDPVWNPAWNEPERESVPEPAPGLPPVRYRLQQGRFAPDVVRAMTTRAIEDINQQ